VITLDCPACHSRLSVADDRAGKKGKCPRCGQRLLVPASGMPAAAAPGRASGSSPAAPVPPTAPAAPGPDPAPPPAALSDSVGEGETAWASPRAGAAGTPGGTAPVVKLFLAPAQAADEMGRLGHYRVLRLLGVGGMGAVFQAEDLHLRRPVALKVMLPREDDRTAGRERFLREARAAAALKHDHIVTIYHVGEDRGNPFLAMEFLEGETLAARLRRDGRLPPAEVARVGREVAEGLAAAHARGLIHRDIKPANLWLEGDRARVKILDFGLVREAGADAHLTREGAIVGTPLYMAPEQARGEAVDGRSDLFSLGGVLYRACTGQRPFPGRDTLSALMSLATAVPPAPHELCPEVPPALSALIMSLLAKNPDDRPATARAVADALAAISEGGAPVELPSPFAELSPVSVTSVLHGSAAAVPVGLPLRGAAGRGRRAWWIAAGLVCLAVAVALGAWARTAAGRGQGDLVVEADGPGIADRVHRAGLRVRDVKTGRAYAVRVGRQALPAGDYEPEVTEPGAGLRLGAKSFTVRPGTPVTLAVWSEPEGGPAAPPPRAVADPDPRADGPGPGAGDAGGRTAAPSGLDAEGFIQRWLVLAPIPLGPNEGGAAALGKDQLRGEAGLRPAAGARVKVGGSELVWRDYVCPAHLLNFNEFLVAQTEDSVAYAVTYVTAPREFKGVMMRTGSDDQCKVYLNGREVFKFTDERAAEKDQDATEVTLKRGVNVLVAKVVNVKVDWAFCVRFTDRDDRPLTGLTARGRDEPPGLPLPLPR
jgi:hypothetical protein